VKLVEVKETLNECEHKDCKHRWKARKENPYLCPKCHRVIHYEDGNLKRVRA
jgi:Zn finger protein HypA/HybF involved in hydrogenase expression